jgi:TetR/AcrR family transcriptional regulator, mexJK operon transcriptional repressor
MSDMVPTIDLDDGRSARKRRAIVEAATVLFLENGYRGTSMDQLATVARVSKQTVYKHFSDKEALFNAIVTATVNEASDAVAAAVRDLQDSGDLAADLRDLARRELELVMEPRILQLRRLVTAEAARFPSLGRMFYERGPGRTIGELAAVFERLADRGQLSIEEPLLAAAHFNWLVMSIPLNRAMLLGIDAPPSPDELTRHAHEGVAVFLAAYGVDPRPRRFRETAPEPSLTDL